MRSREYGAVFRDIAAARGISTNDITCHVIISGAPTRKDARLRNGEVVAHELEERFGVKVTANVTQSPEDLVKLTDAAHNDGAHMLAVLTGDGGAHQIINRQVRLRESSPPTDESNPAVVIFRGGTMNVAAKAHGTPKNIHRAMRALFSGEVKETDLMHMFGEDIDEYSIVSGGIGASSEVISRVEESGRRGPAEYARVALKDNNTYRWMQDNLTTPSRREKHAKERPPKLAPRGVIVSVDDNVVFENNVIGFEVRNGGDYGALFNVDPPRKEKQVYFDDGQLDAFTVVQDHSFLYHVAKLGVQTFARKQFRWLPLPGDVVTMQGERIQVDTTDGEPFRAVQYDGEARGDVKASTIIFQAAPGKLDLIVPRQGRHSQYRK